MAAGEVDVTNTRINGRSCAYFDGVDDKIETNGWQQSEYINKMSFSGWVNRFDTSSTDTIIGSKSATGLFLRFALGATTIGGWVRNNTTGTWTNAGTTGEWMHFVWTIDLDSDIMELFINGTSAGTKTMTDEWSATGNFLIGVRGTAAAQDYFKGFISNIKIWNKILSQTEITAEYNKEDLRSLNLINKFDLISNANDSIGNKNGTATGVTFKIEADDIKDIVSASRVTANDKYLAIPTTNGQNVVLAHIEEAP